MDDWIQHAVVRTMYLESQGYQAITYIIFFLFFHNSINVETNIWKTLMVLDFQVFESVFIDSKNRTN